MPLKTCEICASVLNDLAHRRGSKFCSLKCRNEARRVPKLIKSCLQCGVEFAVVPSNHKRQFCTRECKSAAQRNQIKVCRVQWTCSLCGKTEMRRPSKTINVFCSVSCARKKWDCRSDSDKTKMLRERIDELTDKSSECWVFQGSTRAGYGYISVGRGKPLLGLHRAAWMAYKNEDPGNKFVLHKCDNRRCCNPDHLFLGDHASNADDMKQKCRQHSKLTNESAAKIKSRLKKGESVTKIAQDFEVNRTTIYSIRNSKTWTHV